MRLSSELLGTRVIVTGGSGFLGQNVVKFLAAKGFGGIVLDLVEPNDPDLTTLLQTGDWIFCKCDLGNPKTLRAIPLPSAPLYLIHLAAKVHTSNTLTNDVASEIEIQVGGIFHLLDYCGSSTKGVSLTSTIETYGFPQKFPTDETHPTNPFNIYGCIKLTLEWFLRIYCKRHKIPLAVLRLSHIYGPGEIYERAIPIFIRNCLQGKSSSLVNKGSDCREFIHVTDVARALSLAIEKKADGVFNVTGGRSASIAEILQIIQNLCGSDVPAETKIINKQSLCYEFDLSKARRDLGYAPAISLEDGLLSEIRWVRERAA